MEVGEKIWKKKLSGCKFAVIYWIREENEYGKEWIILF